MTLSLLAALSTLTPTEREAWVDAYVLGEPPCRFASHANRKLRAYYGTPEKLSEAA